MIAVGQFVAWESPNSGVTYKGRVQERREVNGAVTLRIKVAGTYEIEGDALVPELNFPELNCRALVKKKVSS